MSKSTIAILTVLVVCLCSFATIVIGGGIVYYAYQNKSEISDVPYEVNTFLSQEDLDELAMNNFPIYKGFNPPNIVGEYKIVGWNVKYDKMDIFPIGEIIADYYYNFANQDDMGRVDVTFNSDSEAGTGTGAYISGDNGCFTVYIDQTGSSNDLSCDWSMPVVISGCMEENKITNFQYANLMKYVTETEECSESYMPVGNIRIIYPDDGIVNKI